ncbi:MAG: GHKL domain-containing protein, partial [Parasporobacterium sp.]|nr:GHKL domain-containing protein [Parasporobacterium sp.]
KILLENMDRPWRVAGTACDGAEGLTLTEVLRPDIIVTDVKMPVMDGLEMLRRLKDAGCGAGVVVLSGYAEFEYARQAIALGVKAYVTKPVDERELEKALAETSSQLTRFRYTVIAEEQARKERHEIKNTYFYIQALLHDGKYEQLAEYLSKHIGELDDSITGLHTGNLLIDHILNNKIAFARKNKIKIYTEVLIPEQLSINEEHFCTVLLNLLDNAIEASLKETDPDIWIIINIKNNNLICCIKNKVSHDVLESNPKLKTTKADAKNHGQGMRIIRRAVRRMNGIFDASVNNNYFVATVVIPVLSQENSQTPQP